MLSKFSFHFNMVTVNGMGETENLWAFLFTLFAVERLQKITDFYQDPCGQGAVTTHPFFGQGSQAVSSAIMQDFIYDHGLFCALPFYFY